MHISQILHNKGSGVITIAPQATVRDLVNLLKEHNLGAVVVSADTKKLLGIVSERDVIRRLADGPEILDLEVAAIMTTDVHSCTEADDVDSLAALMTQMRVRHVPVLNDDAELDGIISIGDVVKIRMDHLEFERDQLEGYVSGKRS